MSKAFLIEGIMEASCSTVLDCLVEDSELRSFIPCIVLHVTVLSFEISCNAVTISYHYSF